MGLFKQIAEPLILRGVPVIPLRPKSKIAFLPNWESQATTNKEQIEKWDEQFPDHNAACVALAKPGGVWFFEIDRPGFLETIEKEVGQKMPQTFTVRSSPGKGHFYFKHTAASLSMGNAQVKDANGEIWSARTDNRYVVAPLSYHPTSGRRYEILLDTEIADTPDWLVEWILSQKAEEERKSPVTASPDGPKIPRGSHDNTLTRIAGKLRQDGLEEESIYTAIVEVCEKRCEDHGPDFKDMCRKIAHSVSRYPIKEAAQVIMGGVPVGQSAPVAQIFERPVIKPVPYPTFPDPNWVFGGCSMYTGLVKPVCDANPSRRPEFMMMPALAIMLNYVGTKVHVAYKGLIPSIYLVLVARKGKMFKSSSIQDAIEYLNHVGIVNYANQHTRSADGKSLIWTAGSPEGLGIEMTRTNCRNSILFYDELGTLAKKASIDGSNLGQSLSIMYESGLFANTVKGRKEHYSLEPKTYCASLLAATTDKNFVQTMSPIISSAQGNDERFCYIYQPENFPDSIPQVLVNTKEASSLTRQRIEKAVMKGTYYIDADTTRLDYLSNINNRVEQRAEKWALALTIDLGRDTIDDDVIERAFALAKYELAVKKHLFIPETTTREGALQSEVIQILQRHGGSMLYNELTRITKPLKTGTSLWYQVYSGLIKGGWIVEDKTGSAQQVILMRLPEEDD